MTAASPCAQAVWMSSLVGMRMFMGRIINGTAPVGQLFWDLSSYPHGKPGDLFGGNRHRGTRFWVASGARLAAPEPEAPKATQFHFVPGTQGVGDALQEQIDHRFGLVPRELNRCCHLIHEPCLRHARTSPPRGGHSSMLDHGREG